MMATIYIGDLNKLDLLHALWQRSEPAAFFTLMNISPPRWVEEKGEEQARSCGWNVDYVLGRVIKSDLSGDKADPWGYDRDNGEGAFMECVCVVRNNKKRKGLQHGSSEIGGECTDEYCVSKKMRMTPNI
jgi:hypothetical protein